MSVGARPSATKSVRSTKPLSTGLSRSRTYAVTPSSAAVRSMTSTSSRLSIVMRAPAWMLRRMWSSSLGTPLTEMMCGGQPACRAMVSSPAE